MTFLAVLSRKTPELSKKKRRHQGGGEVSSPECQNIQGGGEDVLPEALGAVLSVMPVLLQLHNKKCCNAAMR